MYLVHMPLLMSEKVTAMHCNEASISVHPRQHYILQTVSLCFNPTALTVQAGR